MKLAWRHFLLDFTSKTHVMGILNVTPDSFSDGGRYFDCSSAVERAREMVAEGADIIDVGGLSTRPGSEPVTVDEEIRRTVPVIEAISDKIQVPLSIDTYRAEVARRALAAGAAMINDISGLRFDPEMPLVAAEADVPVIVMHIKGTPRDMQKDPVYEALMLEVMDYLRESIIVAEGAGVDKIIIDPGIGFGKTFDHNLQIIGNLHEFTLMGMPVLIGPSRKAFIGAILDGAPAYERMEGTAAAVTASILAGANIVRVHDVREMSRVVRVADAIKRGSVAQTGIS
jgi:dihydropteroate synthase